MSTNDTSGYVSLDSLEDGTVFEVDGDERVFVKTSERPYGTKELWCRFLVQGDAKTTGVLFSHSYRVRVIEVNDANK